MVSMFRAIRFWLLLHPVVSQNLDSVLSLKPELSRFVESLKLFPELELLLKDNDQQVTLLAPSNDAIAKSSTRFDKPLDWKYHLNETIRSHFIVDALLTADALNSLNSIRVLAGHELQVYGENLVEESTLVTVDLQATNGILHIVDSVLPASFDQYSLADLETQTEFLPPPGGATGRPSLVNIVDSVGREDLKPQEELGLTFLGCDSRALENIDQDYDQTINNSPSVLNGELLNKTRPTEEVLHQFVQYNLLQQNFYFDELSDGLLAASLPVGGCGHVWITKQNGRLCFGDACVLTEPQPRTYLASNGVGFVLDKCLVCPGVAMLMQIANEFVTDLITGLDMTDTLQLFELSLSELNLRNLSSSLGTGGPITIFASTQSGWESLDNTARTRLATDLWIAHRVGLLKNMIVQGEYRERDLYRTYKEEGGPFNLTTLGGEQLLIEYDTETGLAGVAGGDYLAADLVGTDGILHLTSYVPAARSLTRSLYELASDYPEYRQHVAYLDLVPAFEITLQLLSPLTLFLIPDNGWQSRTINPDTVATDVLQNTIFSGLLSCKTLREMAGQQIESRNNRLWTLSVNEKNFPCLAAAGTFGVPVCITQCDLIGKNGVAHRLDAPLALPGVLADAPKSPAPTVDPPITPAPTPTPVPLWADFDFNMCLEALQVGDVDGDGALRRPEYYLFIKEYNRRKCLPPIGEFLTKDQIDLFNSLACQCLDQAEASSTCCLGTTAYIDLRGNLIADQDAYLEEVCRLTDQQLGATLCTPEPSMSPSVVPSMLTQPPASSADSTGGGPSDGSSSGSSGVGGKYYFLGMVSLLGVAAGGLFLS